MLWWCSVRGLSIVSLPDGAVEDKPGRRFQVRKGPSLISSCKLARRRQARASLATTTGALPRCSTVRRRRPLPAPRPVHPSPRGVPPAADKNALRTQLKVNMLRIRERELLFFTNNCLSISTSAVTPHPHTAARLRDLRLTSTRPPILRRY